MCSPLFLTKCILYFLILDTAREDHQCVLLKNPEGDRKTIVVFGGQDTSIAVDSVEFWDLETHTVEEPTDTKFLSQYSNVGSNFLKIDDYKALLFGGLSTDGSFTKEVHSFTIENGFEIGKEN